MKSPYVSEFLPNQQVVTTLLVHSKEIRQKKSGEPYLSLTLGDRTGDMDTKMWDNVAEVMNTFDCDDFLKIKGVPTVYNGRLQLTIHKLARVDEREVDLADYFPASKRDPAEMYAELREIIAGIGNPDLKALLETLFADEELVRRYCRAPAAKSIHHAFLGGLLEHVLSLCRMCRLAASHYEVIDLDLLLTGAILHDVGKVYELTYDRGFGYSSEGQLIGHITIGVRLVEDALRTLPGFPPRLRQLVEHLILSHHGKLEFGSPKVPLFPEALMLHYLDDLDSKMEAMRALVERERLIDSAWTSYSASLERMVLKKEAYAQGKDEPQPEGAAAATPPKPVPSSPKFDDPAPAPRGPAQKPQATPSPSLFGEKLVSALKKEN